MLAGNLAIQVLSLGAVIRTMSLGAGSAVAPGGVIHVGLAAAFAVFLSRAYRPE